MPVVTITHNRLLEYINNRASIEKIIGRLPYLGLDLEQENSDTVKVEYNPNRPDFSTDYGIARALRGLMGFEIGMPEYQISTSGIKIRVDPSVNKVRPIIVSGIVEGIGLDDETVKQIITMQEDLHQGIGRKRQKVAIGLHDLDKIKPDIRYTTKKADFEFTPLGFSKPMSLKKIIDDTEVGKKYGKIISRFDRYPIIQDSQEEVLSFPPIINSEKTKVTQSTKNIFIDITATNLKTAEDALAVLATTFFDAGGQLKTVQIEYTEKKQITPNLKPFKMEFKLDFANTLLGLKISEHEAIECLRKCRINAKNKNGRLIAEIPRYRVDIIHPIDLVEEISLGYGLDRFTPTIPSSTSTGRHKPKFEILGKIRDICIGLGLTEIVNLSLTSENVLFTKINRRTNLTLRVERAKSSEHQYLRDLLIPSLLLTLSKNIHEEYPQKLFEISKTFQCKNKRVNQINEEYHLAATIAHSSSNFTKTKSILTSIFTYTFGWKCNTKRDTHPLFVDGRCAKFNANNIEGFIGEIKPEIIAAFNLRTPISAFEVNLKPLFEI